MASLTRSYSWYEFKVHRSLLTLWKGYTQRAKFLVVRVLSFTVLTNYLRSYNSVEELGYNCFIVCFKGKHSLILVNLFIFYQNRFFVVLLRTKSLKLLHLLFDLLVYTIDIFLSLFFSIVRFYKSRFNHELVQA